MTDRYAVMGNPIAHSKSPFIHARFAEQTGEDLSYEAILVEPGSFPQAVAEFQSGGGRGLNITVPFKEEAFVLATSHSPRAARARAVNTLLIRGEGDLFGDNTDGPGLVNDLSLNHGFDFTGRRVLVLGAGGAVRGVLGPLLDAGPDRVVIANRTAARAEKLAEEFAGETPVQGGGYEPLVDQRFDLIINGTAASLQGDLPPLPDGVLAEGGWCYDMMYGAEPTPFLLWAQRHGAARALDGLGMLVEQAAESFLLWRGVRPETRPVIEALRGMLST
ncbi:MAG: shikimate dehydrogenase [Gammaproteobacteria bacterium]